jgi:hypothetical protein
MPIPTQFDRDLGEIDAMAKSVMVTLSTMHRANPNDRLKMRIRLRERLEQFVDAVMTAASSD